MNFADKFSEIIKDRGMPQSEVARRIGMPYATFRYKSNHFSAWKVTEWGKLVSVLRLTDEEVEFLANDVT